ncbi:MAG: hypothetical protein P0S94_00995 [Simkaniaceae bacterium]|nr:hypothetical protein [Simkaniaceae bacterium]
MAAAVQRLPTEYHPKPYEAGFALLGWPKAKVKDFNKFVRDAFTGINEFFEYTGRDGTAFREFSSFMGGAAAVCDFGSLGSEIQKTIVAVRNWNPTRIFRHGQLAIAYTGSVVKFSSKLIAAVAPSIAPALPFIAVLNPTCSIIPCAMTTKENLEAIDRINTKWSVADNQVILPNEIQNPEEVKAVRKEFYAAKWNEKVVDTVYQVVVIAMCFFSVTAFLAPFSVFASLSMLTISGYGFMTLSGFAVTSALARFHFASSAEHSKEEFGKCFNIDKLAHKCVTPDGGANANWDYRTVGHIAVPPLVA